MIRPFRFLLSASLFLVAQGAASAGNLYISHLDGATESPANASPGTGVATLTFDTVNHRMFVHVEFSGLLGTTTAAHIHSTLATPGTGNVGVATPLPNFIGFPLGVTSGSYDHVYDMTLTSSYSAGFLATNGGSAAAAEAALIAGVAQQRAYLNIHTSAFAPGEIRGFFTAVPEPSSVIALGTGVVGMIAYGRRRLARRPA